MQRLLGLVWYIVCNINKTQSTGIHKLCQIPSFYSFFIKLLIYSFFIKPFFILAISNAKSFSELYLIYYDNFLSIFFKIHLLQRSSNHRSYIPFPR